MDTEQGFNPDLQRPNLRRLQTVDDLSFEEVQSAEADPETVMEAVKWDENDSPEKMVEQVKESLQAHHWWLNKEWQEKGIPHEQLNVRVGELNIDVYNYGQNLTPEQIAEIQQTLGALAQIPLPDRLKEVKYIVISDQENYNHKNNENMRGLARRGQQMFVLYPRAMSSEPHRIPNTSGFKGTVIHEFGHTFQQDGTFLQDWKKTFGWEYLPDDQVDWSKEVPKRTVVADPARCVSDYARFEAEEDICESLVAAISNPEVLDPERLKFIQDRWLKQPHASAPEVQIEHKTGVDVELPTISTQIKYKTRMSTFKPGFKITKTK